MVRFQLWCGAERGKSNIYIYLWLGDWVAVPDSVKRGRVQTGAPLLLIRGQIASKEGTQPAQRIFLQSQRKLRDAT